MAQVFGRAAIKIDELPDDRLLAIATESEADGIAGGLSVFAGMIEAAVALACSSGGLGIDLVVMRGHRLDQWAEAV